MAEMKLKDVTVGMILDQDVLTPKGQLIASNGQTLTAQTLLHMSFYGIDIIKVHYKDADQEPEKESPEVQQAFETHTERIKKTPAFKAFKKDYTEQVNEMSNHLSDFINHNAALDSDKVLASAKKVYNRDQTSIGMLTMLHSMREIDDSTFAHSMNVSVIARIIGEWVGLEEADLDILSLAGLLHDLGKSKIPQSIIGKPGRLTPEEFQIIKKHPVYGYDILKDEDIDLRIKLAALEHHEKCNGSGYPLGRDRSEISPFSSIIAIADIYDAMTANRCYRAGLCPFEVLADMQRNGMDWFPPQFLLPFLAGIADSYIDSSVLLSDGRKGRIVQVPRAALTRPLVMCDDGTFVALAENTALTISAIL